VGFEPTILVFDRAINSPCFRPRGKHLLLQTESTHYRLSDETKVLEGEEGTVVRGTVPQAGRGRVRFPTRSMDFSVDPMLPAARSLMQPLTEMSIGNPPGGKGGRSLRLTTSTSHNPIGLHCLLPYMGCVMLTRSPVCVYLTALSINHIKQGECLQEEIITLLLEWLRRNRIMCRGNEVISSLQALRKLFTLNSTPSPDKQTLPLRQPPLF
jgi:hypothetical protein